MTSQAVHGTSKSKVNNRSERTPKTAPEFAPCRAGSAFTETAGSSQLVCFKCFALSGPSLLQDAGMELLNVLLCRTPCVA